MIHFKLYGYENMVILNGQIGILGSLFAGFFFFSLVLLALDSVFSCNFMF